MRFLRIGQANQEIPAIIDDDDIIRDLSSIIKDFDPININFSTIEKVKNINIKKLPIISNNK